MHIAIGNHGLLPASWDRLPVRLHQSVPWRLRFACWKASLCMFVEAWLLVISNSIPAGMKYRPSCIRALNHLHENHSPTIFWTHLLSSGPSKKHPWFRNAKFRDPKLVLEPEDMQMQHIHVLHIETTCHSTMCNIQYHAECHLQFNSWCIRRWDIHNTTIYLYVRYTCFSVIAIFVFYFIQVRLSCGRRNPMYSSLVGQELQLCWDSQSTETHLQYWNTWRTETIL